MFRQHANIAALVLLASLGIAATTVVAAPGSDPSRPSGPSTGSGGAVTPANARVRREARMVQACTRLSGKASYTSEPRRGGIRRRHQSAASGELAERREFGGISHHW